MRTLGLVAAGTALLGLGAAIGWTARAPNDARHYAEGRRAAVQQHLDEAASDYVFLAGDSQAELQPPAQRPCGLELVNGGSAGANAALYADVLDGLRFRVRPRAAVLAIGTNDLIAKNGPRTPRALARFDGNAERIVRRLRAESDQVVVLAVPPIGRSLADRLDAEAVAVHSEHLRALCARLGCRFADPYAPLRDGASGFARPGAMSNGLHVARYRPVMQALLPALCEPDAAEDQAVRAGGLIR